MPPISVPYNRWVNRVVAWIFTFTAMVLSSVAVKSCRFLKATESDASGSISVNYTGIYRFLFSTGTCVSIDLVLDAQPPNSDSELTASHKAAKAFGVVSPVIGAAAMFLLLSMLKIKLGKCAWRSISGLCFAAFLFQGLTFIIFNDDICKSDPLDTGTGGSVKCTVDEGGNIAIAAMVFYLLSCFIVCCTPPPESAMFLFDSKEASEDLPKSQVRESRPEELPQSQVRETRLIEEGPNGQMIVTTEIINADGSKTTTKSIKQAEHPTADLAIGGGAEQPSHSMKKVKRRPHHGVAADVGVEQPVQSNSKTQYPGHDDNV